MITDPAPRNDQGIHSSVWISRFAPPVAIELSMAAAGARFATDLARTAASMNMHSTPTMHNVIPIARNRERHMI
jgi:hypothetical protein